MFALLDEILEHGVVSARNVCRALNKMSCDQRSRQFIELVILPLVPPSTFISGIGGEDFLSDLRRCTNDRSSISNTTSDDDVSTLT